MNSIHTTSAANQVPGRVFLFLSLVCIAATLFLSGCDKSDPEPVNENELITTLTLRFKKVEEDGQSVSKEPVEFSWRDADGSGPGAPVVDDVILDAGATYELTLTLLDESKSPAVNITDEILEEDEEHQFFFSVTGIVATISYDDADGNGKPIGLDNLFKAGALGQGTLAIILRHEPEKNAAGVEQGNPANAGGETDLDVAFPITFQ